MTLQTGLLTSTWYSDLLVIFQIKNLALRAICKLTDWALQARIVYGPKYTNHAIMIFIRIVYLLCLNVICQTVLLIIVMLFIIIKLFYLLLSCYLSNCFLIIVMLFIHLFYLLLSCYLSNCFTFYCHVIYPSVLLIIVMLFIHLFYLLLSCYLSIWFTYCCHVVFQTSMPGWEEGLNSALCNNNQIVTTCSPIVSPAYNSKLLYCDIYLI